MPYISSPTPTPNPKSSGEERRREDSTDNPEDCDSSQDAAVSTGDGAQRTPQDIDEELFGDFDEAELVNGELFGDEVPQAPGRKLVVRFDLPSTPSLPSPPSPASSTSTIDDDDYKDEGDFIFVALTREYPSLPYDPFTHLISAHKHEATANTFAARSFKSRHPEILGTAALDGESFKRTVHRCVGGDVICREVTTVEKLPLRRIHRDAEWVGPDDDHVFFIWVETAELKKYLVSRRIAAAFSTLESANEVAEEMFGRTAGDEVFSDWVDGYFVGIKRYINTPDTHSLLPGAEEVTHRVAVEMLDMSATGRCRALWPLAEL